MEQQHPIHVAVRMRPALKQEMIISSDIIDLNPPECNILIKKNINTYDQVFDKNSTNAMIYETIMKSKLKSLFHGFNVTILAYGSTGSGKTHTMGITNLCKDDPGIIPLGIRDILFKARLLSGKSEIKLSCSFFEIYLEEIKDLLNTTGDNLQLRGDNQDLKISNLTEVDIHSVDEVMKILERGSENRRTESTAKNVSSSRSHAIFCVNILIVDKESGHSTKSKFQMVDLAGSERAKTSKTEGTTFKEGTSINKSLFTLGKVINAIYTKDKHVPYRESVLTRLLQDSFGGNSFTVMIACISPAQSSIEETFNTLRYATQARCIKNKPVVNKDAKEIFIEKLKQQLVMYEEELAKYRALEKNTKPPVKSEGNSVAETHKTASEEEFIELDNETSAIPPSDTFIITPMTSPTRFSSEDPIPSPEKSPLEIIEEQIQNLDNDLKTKEKDLENFKMISKAMEDTTYFDSVNQLLIEKILLLNKERDALIRKLDKENTQKIQKLEENIRILETQLEKKKCIQDFKASASLREESLKNEIKSLKTSKVDLMRRLKEVAKMQQKKEIEDKKKIAELEKEQRKCLVQWRKKENTLEKRLRILEKKVEIAQANQRRTTPDSSKKELTKNILNSVNFMIDLIIMNAKLEYEIEVLESDADILKNQFRKEEEKVLDQERSREEIKHYKEDLKVLNKKIIEMKKNLKESLSTEESSLASINIEGKSKVLNKSLVEQIKISVREKQKILQDLEKTNTSLENSNSSVKKLIEEKMSLSEEIVELKLKEINEVKHQETQTEEKIQEDGDNMDKKEKEEGDKMDDKEKLSDLLRNYLEDLDVSYDSTSDMNDPDFRATPRYKRKMKRKFTEMGPTGDDISSKKKIKQGCGCPTNCVSIRCSCKKKNVVCTKSCTCQNCLNTPTTSQNFIFQTDEDN